MKDQRNRLVVPRNIVNTKMLYTFYILKELSNRGYTSTKLRKDKIISEGTMQHIRNGKSITIETLNIICLLLRCTPNDIIEIIPTDEEKIKYF